jgi:tryptophan-rich sensory protein
MNTTVSTRAQIAGLIGWLLLCFAAAAIGSYATSASVNGWYQQIARPAWTPPDWIFGPVWTALYAMMAVSAWLVWRQGGFAGARWPLGIFLVQLALNTLWSFIFFGMQQPALAAVEIVVLWIAILLTLLAFQPRSNLAAALLAPYLAWVSFAAILNISIAYLNR